MQLQTDGVRGWLLEKFRGSERELKRNVTSFVARRSRSRGSGPRRGKEDSLAGVACEESTSGAKWTAPICIFCASRDVRFTDSCPLPPVFSCHARFPRTYLGLSWFIARHRVGGRDQPIAGEAEMALITIKIERRTGRVGGAQRRAGRWLLALGATLSVLIGVFVTATGLANASVVSIPPKTIANNVTVPGGGSLPLVVSGGSTTVPTDATRVVFSATVTGATASGSVTANATGSGGSGDYVHYTSGSTATGTLTEPVGLSNQVSFRNTGANSINLKINITGYSTEVRAGDISPTGGSAGQVLTNTGTGAAWQPAGHSYGVTNPFSVQALNTGLTTVASVAVPAGSYVVTFSTTIAGSTSANPDNVGCYLFSPAGNELNAAYGNTYATDDQSVITMQGLVSASSGGTVSAQCVDSDASASAFYPTLIASSTGVTNGYSGAARSHLQRPSGPTAVHK